AEHLREDLGILVEAGGEADRVGEVDSGHGAGQHWIGPRRVPGGQEPERPDRQPMRPLRVEREGEGPEEGVERHGRAMAGVPTRVKVYKLYTKRALPCWCRRPTCPIGTNQSDLRVIRKK